MKEEDRNCFNCRFFEEICNESGESYCHRHEESHTDMWRRGENADPYYYHEKCWSGYDNGKIIEANHDWQNKDN